MTLAPKLPPGRANRKALQFAIDIHRLRSAGYTFSAIRTALLDAGIHVSLSTIKREAARTDPPTLCAQPERVAPIPPSTTVSMTASPDVPTPRPPVRPGATGRQIAEAFFNAHPSNPLFPTRESS
jgi:hypothetical protein